METNRVGRAVFYGFVPDAPIRPVAVFAGAHDGYPAKENDERTSMSAIDTIRARHSVREYLNKPIGGVQLAGLRHAIIEAEQKSGLDIQLVRDNPEVFQVVARFGLVRGATASIVFCTDGKDTDEAIGYWGQRIVLTAQELGLNTCWCALCSRKKSKAVLRGDKKVRIAIAVGLGKTQGSNRKTKPLSELCTVEGGSMANGAGEGAGACALPSWFATAMEAAQLAPTAMNAQNFHVTLRVDGKTVAARTTKEGAWSAIDLGIVRRNFEEAANETGADWRWE